MRGSEQLRAAIAPLIAVALLLSPIAASAQTMDRDNPSCPSALDFSNYRQMRLTPHQADGRRVLLAEGMIDDDLLPRLEAALSEHQDIGEIWFRSPGGNARVGNQAGRMIREAMMVTRVPAGWACFSACNFLFMGGAARYVDAGGHFVVHMFTHTQDREAIRAEVAQGEANTIGLISEIEQQSALLASEDNDFLIRMGVSRDLLTQIMYRTRAVADSQDRATRRCLTQEEVRRYNVVND